MDRICDLHLHSNCSDGSLSPSELARRAKEAGLQAAILTDHNTIRGVKEFAETAKEFDLKTAWGIEISCEYKKREVHILGLFLLPEREKDIKEWLCVWEQEKQKSNQEMAERFRRKGIPVLYEDMQERYAESRLNRVHFAKELCRLGLCEDVREAFFRFLEPERGFYVPAIRPQAEDGIRKIRAWGGLPVLAHPPMNVPWNEMPEYLQWAKKQGAAAAEVYYSTYKNREERRMRELCQKIGLLESGGSDFHGEGRPDIAIGTGRGGLKIPYRVFEKLQMKSEKERENRNGKSQSESGTQLRH